MIVDDLENTFGDETDEEIDDLGDDEGFPPAELVELHEVLEWNAALEEQEKSS